MTDEIKRRKGFLGFTAKVFNKAGNAVMAVYDKGVGLIYPHKTSNIHDLIKLKEKKLKELYYEIGKEHVKRQQSSLVDMEVSDNIKKLISDVKRESLKVAIAHSLNHFEFDSTAEKSRFQKAANDFFSKEQELRILAVNELAKIKTEAAVPVLIEAAKIGDPSLTSEIINALITIGSLDAVPLFKEMAINKNYRIRVACLRGIYKLADEDEEAAQILVNAVKDEHHDVRKSAITFIGWKDNADSVPALVQSLRDTHSEVKKAALDALATIRDKTTVLPIIRLLRDNDTTLREKALNTLKMVTGEKISFDIQASGKERTDAVDNLIDWWQKKRVGDAKVDAYAMCSVDEDEITETVKETKNG